MKRWSYILMFLLTTVGLRAQHNAQESSLAHSFLFTVPAMTFDTVAVDGREYLAINLKDYGTVGDIGTPALPSLVKILEIPAGGRVKVSVIEAQYDTVQTSPLPLLPKQPARSKTKGKHTTFAFDNATYNTDLFIGQSTASVEELGIARDSRLAALSFNPVRYNPVSKQIIVCREAHIEVYVDNADMAATAERKRQYRSSAYTLPNNVATLPLTKDAATDLPLRYVIVAHAMFKGQLDEFIAWKRHQGFIVDAVYTDNPLVGTTQSTIAAYLKSLYVNATTARPAPSYVMLVGDVEQIPAWQSRCAQMINDHITDLYYFTWTDGDYLPDCYYGRLSAQTTAQLQNQIEKILYYEQYGFSEPSYLNTAVLISGVDQGAEGDDAYTYSDPTMDYIARHYINRANGFATVRYYKNNTSFAPMGVTVNGSSQDRTASATLKQLYNNGAGWVNYSAHGEKNRWESPSFNTTDAANMTNNGKPSIMIGNCCLSNHFDTRECLGEALMRQGNLRGATAYIGGSNNTYWDEDFYWSVGLRENIENTMNSDYDSHNCGAYDLLFHTHGEPQSQWHNTMGSMLQAGNLSVESSTSTLKRYYWEVYHLLGDPSMMPWLGEADTVRLEAADVIPMQSSELEVQTAPYAYVALTDNDSLVAACVANSNGIALLRFTPRQQPTAATVSAVAQGYQTATKVVHITSPEGIYLDVKSLSTNQAIVCRGDTLIFTIEVENLGSSTPDSINIELISNNPHLYILDNGRIAIDHLIPSTGETSTFPAFGRAVVSNNVPNNTLLGIETVLRWGQRRSMSSRRHFGITAHAPMIDINLGKPAIGADSSHYVAELRINNSGKANLTGADINLINLNPLISIQPSHIYIDSLAGETDSTVTLSVECAPNVPSDYSSTIFAHLSATTLTRTDTLTLTLGYPYTETFDNDSIPTYTWGGNNYPWHITNDTAHSGSGCLRSYIFGPRQHRVSSISTIEWTSTVDDSISFYYRVSSEEEYDLFMLQIDNSVVERASGEVDWTRTSHFVPAGTHSFRFSYTKDASTTSGEDAVWIDELRLPFGGVEQRFSLDTVCLNMPFVWHDSLYVVDSLGTGNHTLSYSDSLLQHYSLLTINAPQQLTLSASRTTMKQGEHAILVADGADHYLWQDGVTAAQRRVYPDSTETYTITAWNSGCTPTSESITININGSLGAPALTTEANTQLYPNPTKGSITVESESTIAVATLLDLHGRTVKRAQVHAQQFNIDLSKLPNGIYTLHLQSEEGKTTIKKLIKID